MVADISRWDPAGPEALGIRNWSEKAQTKAQLCRRPGGDSLGSPAHGALRCVDLRLRVESVARFRENLCG